LLGRLLLFWRPADEAGDNHLIEIHFEDPSFCPSLGRE
jgi:hypothetical protein